MKSNSSLKWPFILMTGMLIISLSGLGFTLSRHKNQDAIKGSVVKIIRNGRQYKLYFNGKPYFVKGAGGDTHLNVLKKSGGNSIRTWGADNASKILKEADAKGLTVTLGLWLRHESNFDYSNKVAVQKQDEKILSYVRKYKNAPALLDWGLGNEIELHDNPANSQMWKAVNYLAGEIKKIDPNHPVMTVVAGINKKKIDAIKKYYPNIDVLGVNSYGPALTMAQRLKKLGWVKPYMLTEFGPVGWWESPKASWGAPIEANSTVKEGRYLSDYETAVASHKTQCLGSYVFLWGHKFEQTDTWFSMFLPKSEATLGPVDAMTNAWTGKSPKNHVPEIISFQSDAGLMKVNAGSVHHAKVVARDLDQDSLCYKWEIRSEKPIKGKKETQLYTQDIIRRKGNELIFKSPEKVGGYRLFVYVFDGKGKAATANVPFYVK